MLGKGKSILYSYIIKDVYWYLHVCKWNCFISCMLAAKTISTVIECETSEGISCVYKDQVQESRDTKHAVAVNRISQECSVT